MAYIKIDRDKCKGCELCILYCPNKLIHVLGGLNKHGVHVVKFKNNENKCTGCSMCAAICPDCAIEVWKEIKKNEKRKA